MSLYDGLDVDTGPSPAKKANKSSDSKSPGGKPDVCKYIKLNCVSCLGLFYKKNRKKTPGARTVQQLNSSQILLISRLDDKLQQPVHKLSILPVQCNKCISFTVPGSPPFRAGIDQYFKLLMMRCHK